MDPYCGSNQPFVHLLNSQIPLVSNSLNPTLSNSQIHLSQLNFTQESHRTPPNLNCVDKRKLWSPAHDVILCSAWLNTSKDAIVANEQRNFTFWERIADYFNACPEVKPEDRRVGLTCKSRWGKINESVSKFCGAYEYVSRNKMSGENEDNVKSNALKIYKQDLGKTFLLEHCWLELRNEQKWCSTLARNVSGSSKRKLVDDEEAESVPVDSVPEQRPIGVKASKRKSKKKRSENLGTEFSQSALDAYQLMFELKEKEVELRKESGKTTMLETLLAKTTLTDLEMKLKDKLLRELLDD